MNFSVYLFAILLKQKRIQVRFHFNHPKMLGGDNGNPIFGEDNQMQYHLKAVNQLQLFGNLPIGCNVDPTNYFGNDQNTPMLRPSKRGREAENMSMQLKLQNSLSYNVFLDEADRLGGIPNQTRVSTGLKLSYDDDERNSSVTSSSSSMIAKPPFIMSLGDNIKTELDWQKELDQYIKTQEQVLAKGMREITQRQMARFLSAIEKGVNKKLQEKDLEIENIKRKNIELGNKIQQAVTDAQCWHNKAKYNESRISVLKNHLQQAISQGADQGKEGFGDSEIEDTASYIDPSNYLGVVPNGTGKKASVNHGMVCKACKRNEVSVLLMPCRHLCLCKECDGQMLICPICHVGKTAGVKVYFP